MIGHGLLIKNIATLKITKSWRKKRRMFLRIVGEYRLWFIQTLVYLFPKDRYLFFYFNPFPDDKILDWSKLKQFADDNFKPDENSRKFSKR